jgi:fructokinase
VKRIVCVGETLIDFIAQTEVADIAQTEFFRRAAGGAVSNVAVGVARLGGNAAFIGTIGRDAFGKFLLQTLAHENVDVDATRLVDAQTTLAFVARGPQGARDFEFVRNPGADSLLRAADLDVTLLEHAAIVHFGGVLLSVEPGASACLQAASVGRESGALVTFDPNVRPALFASADHMRTALKAASAQAHLVKCSAEDLAGMDLQQSDLLSGLTETVIVTDGAGECAWMTKGGASGACAPPKVKAVDTTGAGDAFMAAVLVRLADVHGLRVTPEAIADAVRYACAAGAFAVTKEGAIPSLPRARDVEAMLHR